MRGVSSQKKAHEKNSIEVTKKGFQVEKDFF